MTLVHVYTCPYVGEFGIVYKGELAKRETQSSFKTVAVKTLKGEKISWCWLSKCEVGSIVEPRYSEPLKCGHLVLTDVLPQYGLHSHTLRKLQV